VANGRKFLQSVSADAVAINREIHASKGIMDAIMNQSGKGRSLANVTGKGLQDRKPPKSNSARVLPDGTFGKYKVEVDELRCGSLDGGAVPGGTDYIDGSHVTISYSLPDIYPHALARRNVVFAYCMCHL